jgi:hypothetical protein
MFIRSNFHRVLSYIFAVVALSLLLGYGNAFAATPVGTVTENPLLSYASARGRGIFRMVHQPRQFLAHIQIVRVIGQCRC